MNNIIVKLTNNDIVIGNLLESNETEILIEHPYSVYDFEGAPCVMPYEINRLVDSMFTVGLRTYDIMWSKPLSDFPTVEKNYVQATTGIQQEPKEELILG